jgi:hypothetical protein
VARRLPDGRIEVLGGVAGTAALRGLRVDYGRIEAVLARHPAVRQVTVTVEEVEPGDPHLVAHVVPGGGEPPTLPGLQVHLWRELPGYPWPRRLVLADAAGGGAREADAASPTPEERLLAGLWADALGVPRVPVDENYWQRFSFLDAVARAGEAGIRLDAAQVSHHRTIAGLAAELAAERARRAGPADPG